MTLCSRLFDVKKVTCCLLHGIHLRNYRRNDNLIFKQVHVPGDAWSLKVMHKDLRRSYRTAKNGQRTFRIHNNLKRIVSYTLRIKY